MNAPGWQVNRVVNLGSIVAVIGLVASMFLYANSADNRITELTVKQKAIVEQQQRDRRNTRAMLQDIKGDLEYIRQRIDNQGVTR